MKYCPKCKQNKEENEFYRDKVMKGGLYVYCKKCSKDYDKKRYPKEQERRRKQAKKWRRQNREHFNKIRNEWQKRNPEKMKRYSKKYRLNIKSRFPKLKYAGAKFKKEDFLGWYDKQKKECFYCGIPENELSNNKKFLLTATDGKLTFDKKNPEGEYTLDNMVLSCMRCNLIKSNFFSVDEMKQLSKQFITPKWQQMK